MVSLWSQRFMGWMAAAAVASLALGALGCDDELSIPPDMAVDLAVRVPNNFDQINEYVLQPSCAAFSVCHSTKGQNLAGKLNLEVDPYAALVGQAANNRQAAAEGLLRVRPCEPDQSFLLTKLNLPVSMTDPDVGYGSSMPDSNDHLPAPVLSALRDWIARGALRDEPVDVTGSTCNLGGADLGTTD